MESLGKDTLTMKAYLSTATYIHIAYIVGTDAHFIHFET